MISGMSFLKEQEDPWCVQGGYFAGRRLSSDRLPLDNMAGIVTESPPFAVVVVLICLMVGVEAMLVIAGER